MLQAWDAGQSRAAWETFHQHAAGALARANEGQLKNQNPLRKLGIWFLKWEEVWGDPEEGPGKLKWYMAHLENSGSDCLPSTTGIFNTFITSRAALVSID